MAKTITKQDILDALMEEARRREGPTATAMHLEARCIWIAAEWQLQHEYDHEFKDFDGVLRIISGRPPLNLDNWAFDRAVQLTHDRSPSEALEEFKYEIHNEDPVAGVFGGQTGHRESGHES